MKLNHQPIDTAVFKKDMLDKCKLKNAKRACKKAGQTWRPVTVFKVAS